MKKKLTYQERFNRAWRFIDASIILLLLGGVIVGIGAWVQSFQIAVIGIASAVVSLICAAIGVHRHPRINS